jgi:hypothetical protein
VTRLDRDRRKEECGLRGAWQTRDPEVDHGSGGVSGSGPLGKPAGWSRRAARLLISRPTADIIMYTNY